MHTEESNQKRNTKKFLIREDNKKKKNIVNINGKIVNGGGFNVETLKDEELLHNTNKIRMRSDQSDVICDSDNCQKDDVIKCFRNNVKKDLNDNIYSELIPGKNSKITS